MGQHTGPLPYAEGEVGDDGDGLGAGPATPGRAPATVGHLELVARVGRLALEPAKPAAALLKRIVTTRMTQGDRRARRRRAKA